MDQPIIEEEKDDHKFRDRVEIKEEFAGNSLVK